MNGHRAANGEGDDDERELVARARGGDRLAMRQVVERHQHDVLYLALGMLGNRHDAEDAMQEVFVNAFDAIGRFRGESRLSTWLYGITLNVCREQRRRRWRWSRRLEPLEGSAARGLADDGPAGNPHGHTARLRLQRDLARALERLSPAQRQVFVLRKFRELSVAETANVLGLAEGTVKALLFRALRKLRRELADDGPSEDAS